MDSGQVCHPELLCLAHSVLSDWKPRGSRADVDMQKAREKGIQTGNRKNMKAGL